MKSELIPGFDPEFCVRCGDGEGLVAKLFNRVVGDVQVNNVEVLRGVEGRKVYVAPHYSHIDEALILKAIYAINGDVHDLPVTLAKNTAFFRLVNLFGLLDKFKVIKVENGKVFAMKGLVRKVLEEADLLFFPDGRRRISPNVGFNPLLFGESIRFAQSRSMPVYVCPTSLNYEPGLVEDRFLESYRLGEVLMEKGSKLLRALGGVIRLGSNVGSYGLGLLDYSPRVNCIVSFNDPIDVREYVEGNLKLNAGLLKDRAEKAALS